MDIRVNFGNKVRELRLQKGMSQEELAHTLGMRPSTLSSLELGKSFVSYRTLNKLCEVLETTPKYLFDYNVITPTSENTDIIKAICDLLPEINNLELQYLHKMARIFAHKD